MTTYEQNQKRAYGTQLSGAVAALGLLLVYATFAGGVLSSALANDEPAGAAVNDEASYSALVPKGTELYYRLAKQTLPTERYIDIALFDLESVGQASSAKRPQPLDPLKPPAGWPLTSPEGETARGTMPFSTHEGTESCRCATDLGDSEDHRYGALYAWHEFELSQEKLQKAAEQNAILVLTATFKDGMRAFVNGRKIASRNWPLSSGRFFGALFAKAEKGFRAATSSRGPEEETFVVALSASNLRAGTNLLALEVMPSKHRQGLHLDIAMHLRAPLTVVRGPILQRVRNDSALITFDTELPSRASVRYRVGTGQEQRIAATQGALARHHRAELSGLEAGTQVHYQLIADGREGPWQYFFTPPQKSEPLHFAVYGDTRGGHKVHAEIVTRLLAEAIDFVVVTGDLVLRGSDEGDWQRFFRVAQPLLARFPYYPVAGNHDMGRSGDEARRMNEIFALWPPPEKRPSDAHWHSFEVSGVHFVMLDSNRYSSEEQLTWLQADLEAATKSGVRAIFAVVHAGPYSRGLHLGDKRAARLYAPLLRRHGVDLLFSGHDHIYQRGEVDGLPYVVSGGEELRSTVPVAEFAARSAAEMKTG